MVSVPPVVGDASTLIDAFDYFRVAGKLGVAIIRSPTGWGKTSEVRQLYADLADRQGSVSLSLPVTPRRRENDRRVACRRRFVS